MKSFLRVLFLVMANVYSSIGHAAPEFGHLSDEFRARLEGIDLIYSFQGKGSSVAYDVGTLKVAVERIASLKEKRTIVTGNSSGAIMVSYLACHGITTETVTDLEGIMIKQPGEIGGAVSAIRKQAENTAIKLLDFIRTGKIPSIDTTFIDPFIKAAVGVDSIANLGASSCFDAETHLPKVSFAIVAANQEVLDNFDYRNPLAFRALDQKTYNYSDFSASWKKPEFERYQKDADAFQKDHPLLILGEDPYIGQTCTYFLSADLYAALSATPETERLCDLRLVDTAEDLALAIRASVSEPTYFGRVKESNLGKMVVRGASPGNLGNSKERHYWGGFSMPLVAHDFRRLLPKTRVLGTGWISLPTSAEEFLAKLSLVKSNQVTRLSEFWSDLSFAPPPSVAQAIINRKASVDEEFNAGEDRAKECLEQEQERLAQGGDKPRCLPTYINKPALRTPFETAIIEGDMDDSELERGRGVVEIK